MKKITKWMVLFLLILSVTGCSNNNSNRNAANNSNSVDKVMSEQIGSTDDTSENADNENTNIETPGTETIDTEENSGTDSETEQSEETAPQSADGVDYDLTTMGSDMIYATVYQMMVDPDSYIGKTIRMDGLYYAGYDERTEKYYHYCIIQDAMACCAQGLEFVWGDGSHIYPDEYPQDNTEVVVQGVFEIYEEDGFKYCRLKDATLEMENQ